MTDAQKQKQRQIVLNAFQSNFPDPVTVAAIQSLIGGPQKDSRELITGLVGDDLVTKTNRGYAATGPVPAAPAPAPDADADDATPSGDADSTDDSGPTPSRIERVKVNARRVLVSLGAGLVCFILFCTVYGAYMVIAGGPVHTTSVRTVTVLEPIVLEGKQYSAKEVRSFFDAYKAAQQREFEYKSKVEGLEQQLASANNQATEMQFLLTARAERAEDLLAKAQVALGVEKAEDKSMLDGLLHMATHYVSNFDAGMGAKPAPPAPGKGGAKKDDERKASAFKAAALKVGEARKKEIEALKKRIETLEAELKDLRASVDTRVGKLQNQHQQKLTIARAKHAGVIENLKVSHFAALQRVRGSQDERVASVLLAWKKRLFAALQESQKHSAAVTAGSTTSYERTMKWESSWLPGFMGRWAEGRVEVDYKVNWASAPGTMSADWAKGIWFVQAPTPRLGMQLVDNPRRTLKDGWMTDDEYGTKWAVNVLSEAKADPKAKAKLKDEGKAAAKKATAEGGTIFEHIRKGELKRQSEASGVIAAKLQRRYGPFSDLLGLKIGVNVSK
jgi:polyhydroxyalkanoate synthesis regulator phasin